MQPDDNTADDHYSARWPVLDDDEIQLVGRDLHHWLAPARLRARLDVDNDVSPRALIFPLLRQKLTR